MPTKNRALEENRAAQVEPPGAAGQREPADAGLTKLAPVRPERRREPRYRAEGEVCLWPDQLPIGEIHGRLVDISRHGFRVAHQCQSLAAGERVRFRHAGGQGAARVIWNRIVPGGVESGLLVL